jgi:hypothetical protein
MPEPRRGHVADEGIRTHLRRHAAEVREPSVYASTVQAIRQTSRCPLCPPVEWTREELADWFERTRDQ